MRKSRRCFSPFFLGIACLLISDPAYPENQEYKEHTVSRGETLWGISSKEIVDPFLWPKIWKENPEIKDPDRIYPGQKLRIPLYLLQKEMEGRPIKKEAAIPMARPEGKAAEKPPVEIPPMKKQYLVDMDTLISSGYIAESVESKGKIIGSPSERLLLGKGDDAYIKKVTPPRVGDRFYIIRSAGRVKHPQTGTKLGYLIEIVGILEATGNESGQERVKITASFGDVAVGDLLTDYYEMEQPFLVENPRTPPISGFIVVTKQRRSLNTLYDIVYIDKGRRDGIEIGDMVQTVSAGRYDIPNGLIQVINAGEKTATAIVRKSEKEVQAGDRVGAL